MLSFLVPCKCGQSTDQPALSSAANDQRHPKSVINVPFPSQRLANIAFRALSVDQELSPLVRRSFSLTPAPSLPTGPRAGGDVNSSEGENVPPRTVLKILYRASTNRMLRVAVNGFFESIGVVLNVMEELDVDMISGPIKDSLHGVQGLEAN